jgi:hypothetical protein
MVMMEYHVMSLIGQSASRKTTIESIATCHPPVLKIRHAIEFDLARLNLLDRVLEGFLVLALLDAIKGSMTIPFVSAAMSGVDFPSTIFSRVLWPAHEPSSQAPSCS